MKTIITTKNAPNPIGPYSQAVKSGNLIYVSGMVAKDPVTGNMVIGDIQAETKKVMENIRGVLVEAGSKLDNIVKTTIFMTNMDDFAKMNETYGSFFSGNFPARETVQVSRLPLNVNVEISVIAEV
ncbi:MAG TPA: RidA family protein [Bacteroidia bacterium]|jgi:2-iminobutanoate/2-iminopropanoate deaminase|nr:RidA family protein [Bacteroidia bacterium]